MKNKLIYLLLITIGFTACSEEEPLTPSLMDIDRVATQVDLSKPLVKQMYENYNCGILYEFDYTLDFAYVASSNVVADNWNMVNLEKLDISNVDYALDFLETNVFQYFKNEIEFNGTTYEADYILNHLPFKILVCREINTTNGSLFDPLTLSDSRATEDGKGILHSIANDHTFVFGVDKATIEVSNEKYQEFSKDNFFLFIVHIMDMHNMYDLVPNSFFELSKDYFGESVGFNYTLEGDTIDKYGLVDKDWFLEKGFVDARYFYKGIGLTELPDIIAGTDTIEKAVYANHYFLDSEASFVNSYLNEMIHTNSLKLESYPEIIKEKFKILIEQFLDWGVDIDAVNPELKTLYDK